MTISGNFKRFQYFNFETDLLGSENLYRGLEYCLFGCGHLGSRRVVCVWGCRVGAGAGAGVLSVAALFLWVFGFGLRAYCGVGLVCRRAGCLCFPWALEFYLAVLFPCEYP